MIDDDFDEELVDPEEPDDLAPADNDVSVVVCPWCAEQVELYVDPGQIGSFVEDCAVCCRPWRVSVWREGGRLFVMADRS